MELLAHFVTARRALLLTLAAVLDSIGATSRKALTRPLSNWIDSRALPRPLTGTRALACLGILQKGCRRTAGSRAAYRRAGTN